MRERKTIWILEDDEQCRFMLRNILESRYDLRLFVNMAEFREHLLDVQLCTLLIADLKLPDGSFFQFLLDKTSRSQLHMPFMIVSGAEDEDILRTCFNEGASDVLVKPFHRSEITVKVEKLVGEDMTGVSDGFSVDTVKRIIQGKDNLKESLTSREVQILTAMSGKPRMEIKRQDLVASVWEDVLVGARTLDVHLHNLRKKLRRVGYHITYMAPDTYVLTRFNGQEQQLKRAS